MEEENENGTQLVPRCYQKKIIRIVVEKNSIVFLPTGSGKTFISLCVLKELVKNDFEKTYSEGGKIAVVLVNTVTLVQQHAKYFQTHLPFKVSSYTGDCGVDFWNKEKWLEEYDKNNVLIMTSQIFLNCLNSKFLDMNKVNVMIFDECHQAVDFHAMRQIMIHYPTVENKPRVIGLTATLLNGNVKSSNVLNEIEKLETTFHAKVAAIDDLNNILGFSTNPKEEIISYKSPVLSEAQQYALHEIEKLLKIVRSLPPPTPKIKLVALVPLEKEINYHKFIKLLLDAQIHIKMLGMSGANIALTVYNIHLEMEKSKCTDRITDVLINSIITKFVIFKKLFEKEMIETPEDQRLYNYSSHKVKKLLEILQNYNRNTDKELCGIIFVQRKNTAMILYHILKQLVGKLGLNYVKPDFIIGFNSNPLNTSKESLYYSKVNKKILEKFHSKECNLLIASNVIEEGIDMQNCTLVVKFDTPTNYREYVQSKGRARHQSSLFYIMVEDTELSKFSQNYYRYQVTEKDLQNYLVSQDRFDNANGSREETYANIPPFYVAGPNSAYITMLSAIPLLMMYCSRLQTDSYTTYEPEWYIQRKKDQCSVIVELPIVSPIKFLIQGDYFSTKKDAKRHAAFKTCILLYKYGELDNNLIPQRKIVNEEQTTNLFTHWPEKRDINDGLSNNRRIYEKKVPSCVNQPLIANQKIYLHIIELKPLFNSNLSVDITLAKLYGNQNCFGILTANPLPNICEFSVYTSQGEIFVRILMNQKEISLQNDELLEVKKFHHLIFSDVLNVLKSFLTQSSNTNIDHLYIVPIKNDHTKEINFQIIQENKEIVDQFKKPSMESIKSMIVNKENWLHKIVTPYYRLENRQYVVLDVCEDKDGNSMFPKEEFGTYVNYFQEKYRLTVHNRNHPLLWVKPISAKLNFIKPRGDSAKRSREEAFDSNSLHLIPELCIRQKFPAELWLQAKLLPTILERIMQFLRAEEIRSTIAVEENLGAKSSEKWQPLKLDKNLIHYNTNTDLPESKNPIQKIAESINLDTETTNLSTNMSQIKIQKNIYNKINDSMYPWLNEEEPKDINRSLNCTLLDIKYYSKFISSGVNLNFAKNGETSKYEDKLAINFDKQFEHKSITFFNKKKSNLGPDLSTIYQALATAKCNEIVNLERMETLGDSFLKYIISLFIYTKFPSYSEGQSTDLKSRLISNRNLYYLGTHKNICSAIKTNDLLPSMEWRPPGYGLPDMFKRLIDSKELSADTIFGVNLSEDEQVTGVLLNETCNKINELLKTRNVIEDDIDDIDNNSIINFMGQHIVSDKTIADVMEALIGAYYSEIGNEGAIIFMEWLGLVPKSEHLMHALTESSPSPLFEEENIDKLNFLLPKYYIDHIESIFNYKFNDKSYILQAITHSSYTTNRITLSYERLEFIGDAVLDFLITSFIYESCGYLTPGDLTDLRSALVNNEIFAAYVVKLKLHKYLKYYSSELDQQIMKFVMYQEKRNNIIDHDVLILLNERDINVSECVDVPKVLGDLYETFIGAIFLDCGKNLDTVWKVVYRVMHEEIEMFSKNIPKNAVKMLYEKMAPLRPKFHPSTPVVNSKSVMVKLDFQLKGRIESAYGFGDNKKYAKKAAAKCALKLLQAN